MVTLNNAAKELSCKIVYYGPGLGGKTTNLQMVHRRIPEKNKSDMVSLATESDRTLFFDFLPLDLGKIKGFTTKFHLYTVPGQVFYNETRRMVLRGADGVVFVADSQANKKQENIESFNNLEDNLREQGISLQQLPLLIQFNKRDCKNILSVEELKNDINKYNSPCFEAVALKGEGVIDCLKLISSIVIKRYNAKFESGASSSGKYQKKKNIESEKKVSAPGPSSKNANDTLPQVKFSPELESSVAHQVTPPQSKSSVSSTSGLQTQIKPNSGQDIKKEPDKDVVGGIDVSILKYIKKKRTLEIPVTRSQERTPQPPQPKVIPAAKPQEVLPELAVESETKINPADKDNLSPKIKAAPEPVFDNNIIEPKTEFVSETEIVHNVFGEGFEPTNITVGEDTSDVASENISDMVLEDEFVAPGVEAPLELSVDDDVFTGDPDSALEADGKSNPIAPAKKSAKPIDKNGDEPDTGFMDIQPYSGIDDN
ncbi:MAG: hypothetical protein HQK83_16840 [Fibrobacteria bacterium]|nr:hypothetical protein [Fibrobacteria bacterium]